MTAHDFLLLFATFAVFVVLPALLFWGFTHIIKRQESGTSGPDIDTPDASGDNASLSARRVNHRRRRAENGQGLENAVDSNLEAGKDVEKDTRRAAHSFL